MKNPVIAVLGPTASGKTGLALQIAQAFGGEIVNCDSRQIYKEMEIGTAKPTPEEMAQTAHHLFDIISPDQEFSAGDYIDFAKPKILEILKRGKVPILTGGTGFYYSAISEGLSNIGNDTNYTQELQKEFESNGISPLVSRLIEIDPQAPDYIDINNHRRVIRALEIYHISGKKLSEVKPIPPLPEVNFYPVVITQRRILLHQRIEIRVEKMFQSGLLKECEKLFQKYDKFAPGLKSIGYSEFKDFFFEGKSLEFVKEKIIVNTRRYAKRQDTWFKKRPGVPVIDISQKKQTEEILADIKRFLAK